MIHIYYITIVLTAILSSITTMYAPNIIARYKQYRTANERKFTRMVRDEVEKQLKDILDND